MKQQKSRELLVFILIILVASFFRIYKINSSPEGFSKNEAQNVAHALESIKTGDYQPFYVGTDNTKGLFITAQAWVLNFIGPLDNSGNAYPLWALRILPAIIGILTVIGVYLLARVLFDWRTAAFSGFIMAVSFWAVNFSRQSIKEILLPFFTVYAFYFLWKGLKFGHKQNFFWAGIFGGLGFYADSAFWLIPFVAIIVFINYWNYLEKDFGYSKFEHTKNQLLKGFIILFLVAFIVSSPICYHLVRYQQNFFTNNASGSILTHPNIYSTLGSNVVKTLAMFNFNGDTNPAHNIPGAPLLLWPVGILFIIGFFKELGHWLSKKHGHFSTVHSLLLSWFFIMLLPGIFSIETPSSLYIIGAIIPTMIFAGRGAWWIFDKLGGWYDIRDAKVMSNKEKYPEGRKVATITAVILMLAIGFYEYSTFFDSWLNNPDIIQTFSQHSITLK